MVRVRYNGKSSFGLTPDVTLYPGVNEVEEEVLEKLRDHKAVRGAFDEKLLEFVGVSEPVDATPPPAHYVQDGPSMEVPPPPAPDPGADTKHSAGKQEGGPAGPDDGSGTAGDSGEPEGPAGNSKSPFEGMTADDAIKAVAEMMDAGMLQEARASDESRKTVLRAVEGRLAELQESE